MHKGRLEAFTDAVIAIIMTVMVLELKAPHDASVESLKLVLPELLTYVLSFVFLGIYWNNHHHMVQAAKHVSGGVLWANMHVLFWLSLVPFATDWMGNQHFAQWPVVLYGVILLMCGVGYTILANALVAVNGADSPVAVALGKDVKGKFSVVIYATAIGMAFVTPYAACVLYGVVSLMWLVPDRRFERRV